MSLVEIKDFNALIDNKPFFDQPVKNKQEAYQNLVEITRNGDRKQENYQIICIIKTIINSLV